MWQDLGITLTREQYGYNKKNIFYLNQMAEIAI
jgi:hypothetical protein